MCLILKNIKFFNNNVDYLNGINLFSEENKLVFETIKNLIGQNEQLQIENLNLDPKIIEKIFNSSSIKYILDKGNLDEIKMLEFFNEIRRDLKNHELEMRIEELETKFSEDFNENTFNELEELKKMQKIN